MNNAKMLLGLMFGYIGLALTLSGVDNMNCFTVIGGGALIVTCGILCRAAMPKVLD